MLFFAFKECTSLKTVKLTSNQKNVGFSIFSECRSLEKISIPPSLIETGQKLLSSCTSLKKATIPSHFILAVITNVFSAPVINYFLFIPDFNFLPIKIDRNADHVNLQKLVKEMKEDKKYASAPAEIATVASTSKEKKAVKAKSK